MRQNYSSRKNIEFFDELLQEINEGVVATATQYFYGINKLFPAEVQRLRNMMSKRIKTDACGKFSGDLLGHTKSSN